MEDINKKRNLRKIFKDVVNKTLNKVESLMKDEIIDEEKIDTLLSYQDTIKKKFHMIKLWKMK